MRYQITLDAGTTNIRAFLWENAKKLIAVRKSGTGVGCAAVEGNNKRVKEAVKECIDDLLTEGNITSQEVECILASGMLTSNVGLYEIPHIIAPAGIPEFADGIKKVLISEISEIPFWFIPGMKNFAEHADIENVEGMDMMRGEEVEAIALLKMLPRNEPYLLILPGSHTKFVATAEGKLTGCLTTLSGELLSVLTMKTILADAVGRKFVEIETYNQDMVELGYKTAKSFGLARAAFLARILQQQTGCSREQTANYLLGTVLEQDIRALRCSKAVRITGKTKIILSGKEILCRALRDLFCLEGEFSEVSVFDSIEDKDTPLSARGSLEIYNYIDNKSQ